MRFHTCARFLASALVVARLAGVGPGTAGGSALAAEWSAAQRDSVERLFAVDSHDSRLLEVDVVTGLSSTVDTLFPVSPGSDFRGLEYDGDLGLLLAVESAGHQLRTVDPFTGETAFVCNLATETSRGVAYDASAGVLYVVGWYPWPFESYLYRVHRPTGNTIYVGNIGYEHVSGLAFDRATGVLYGVCDDIFGGTPGRLLTIDVDTGIGTEVATTHPFDDISFDSEGQLYGIDCGPFGGLCSLFTVNKSTGEAAFIGTLALWHVNTLAFAVLAETPVHRRTWTSIKALYRPER